MIQDTVSNSNNNNNKTPTKNSPRRVQLKQKVWLCTGISRDLKAPDGRSYPRPTASWWLWWGLYSGTSVPQSTPSDSYVQARLRPTGPQKTD